MKVLKVVFVVILILIILGSGGAQDFRALRVGPFSGINAHNLNPSYHRKSNILWDLNLIGTGFDLSTNYGHFNNKSGIGFVNSIAEISEGIENIKKIEDIPSALDVDFQSRKNTRAHLDYELNGPGIILNLPQYSIGLFTKVSILGHMNDLPNFDEALAISDLSFGEKFDFPEANFGFINLIQIGLSLSTTKELSHNAYLHYGANIKNYSSTDFLFAQSNKPSVAVKKMDSLQFVDAELEGAFFSSYGYSPDTNSSSYDAQVRGIGWGVDLGIIYEFEQNSFEEKSIRIGVSIADIGYLKYTNGYFHNFSLGNGHIIQEKFLNEDITIELSKSLDIEDKIYIELSQEKTIVAPASLNLMAEYPYNDKILLSLAIRENIPFISPIERSSYISATAQYNRKWISYTVPISLYNHTALKLGSAVRLGPLTIGTDNLIPLILPFKLRSANFFLNLNINSSMFNISGNRKGKKKKLKNPRRNLRKVKCYY